jgi:hypothetical protein
MSQPNILRVEAVLTESMETKTDNDTGAARAAASRNIAVPSHMVEHSSRTIKYVAVLAANHFYCDM